MNKLNFKQNGGILSDEEKQTIKEEAIRQLEDEFKSVKFKKILQEYLFKNIQSLAEFKSEIENNEKIYEPLEINYITFQYNNNYKQIKVIFYLQNRYHITFYFDIKNNINTGFHASFGDEHYGIMENEKISFSENEILKKIFYSAFFDIRFLFVSFKVYKLYEELINLKNNNYNFNEMSASKLFKNKHEKSELFFYVNQIWNDNVKQASNKESQMDDILNEIEEAQNEEIKKYTNNIMFKFEFDKKIKELTELREKYNQQKISQQLPRLPPPYQQQQRPPLYQQQQRPPQYQQQRLPPPYQQHRQPLYQQQRLPPLYQQ